LREKISGKLLKGLEGHTPGLLLSIQYQVLTDMTARAFGAPRIRVWTLDPERAFEAYARFSADCMKKYKGDPQALCREAYRTGQTLRALTGFRDRADLERLVFYLYRNIRIRMEGTLPGHIRISACYFSTLYTPSMCALMSRADSGIIAGLLGGGALTFTERITEGCGECRACFEISERKNLDP